jgi:hypothetical protein
VLSKPLPSTIPHNRVIVAEVFSLLLDKALQESRCLGQQGTQPFPATFAENSEEGWTLRPEVNRPDGQDLLDSCSCIVKQCQEYIVAFAPGRKPIDLCQEMFQLFLHAVTQHSFRCPSERNRQYALTERGERGLPAEYVAKEAVDGSQAGVSSPGGVMSAAFKISEKVEDSIRIQVRNDELGYLTSSPIGNKTE